MKVYEFYLNRKWGDDTWHWDLEQWELALKDLQEYKNEDGFCLEIQITNNTKYGWDTDVDYVELFPNNNSRHLPKYVQRYIAKIMNAAKEVK